MPAAAKTPFSSKNPATIAKQMGAVGFSGATNMQQGGEVVCPLFNSDGSQCRKKCVGNFAYRSICEHIRRAHPDNWIPKLPASPETFAKMVGMNPNGRNGTAAAQHQAAMRKQTLPPASRKPSKLSKHDGEQYFDGLSPPSSANESEALMTLSTNLAPHQNFQSRFPPANTYGGVVYDREDDDDEDMNSENVVDEEVVRHHTETETEDEDYNNAYGTIHQFHPQHPYLPQTMHSTGQRPRANRPKSQKRKRQSTFDSTASSSSSFSTAGSRWHELIEAATTRAVVESSPLPLSPPQTSGTLSSNCPNSPVAESENTSSQPSSAAKIQCAECSSCAPITQSYVCTECVSGFCEDCALSAGKRGICSECRAFGAKFKPLKIVIRT